MSKVTDGIRRGCGRSATVAAVLVLALASDAASAAAQTTSTTSTASSTTKSGAGSVISLGSTGRVVFIVLVVGIFAALWFALLLYDRISVNKRLNLMLGDLLANMKSSTSDTRPSAEEIQTLSTAMSSQPGTQGLTRTLLALGLLTLLGVALAGLLVGNDMAASDLLKGVVTALTTALTTILGFYFGAKTATDATTAAGASPTGPAGPTATRPDPPTHVVATAGNAQAEVSFTPPTTGSSPTRYTVTSASGEPSATASGPKSPITVPGLTNGVAYSFTVHATDAVGDNSKESTPSNAVTPTP